jgi:hypothetical protein
MIVTVHEQVSPLKAAAASKPSTFFKGGAVWRQNSTPRKSLGTVEPPREATQCTLPADHIGAGLVSIICQVAAAVTPTAVCNACTLACNLCTEQMLTHVLLHYVRHSFRAHLCSRYTHHYCVVLRYSLTIAACIHYVHYVLVYCTGASR